MDAQHTCATNNGNLWRQQINFDSLPAVAPATGNAAAFSETQTYAYTDPANRVSQASTSSWTQPFGYDALGNRWVNTMSGLQAPSAAETATAQSWYNTANQINTWKYDETGNILQISSISPSRVFTYDAENRQMTAAINGTTSSYVYDGDGRCVQVTTQSGTTTFVYDAEGHLAQEYSTAPASDVGTSYLFGDHLGSTRLITDGSGIIKKRFDYLPFGEEILSTYGGRTDAMGYNDGGTVGVTDKQRLKFTSKERDAETGLDYFGARYFSSAQGRFTSPDEPFADQHLENPQSWNLYGYTTNNPLRYVDTDGRVKKDADGNVVFTKTGSGTVTFMQGSPITFGNGRAGSMTVTWQADFGKIYADDGTAIDASKATSDMSVTVMDSKGKTVVQDGPSVLGDGFSCKADCHGTTFAEGQGVDKQ